METELELADAEYGFTYCRVEGRYLLRTDDGDVRQVNEAVVDLLRRVASGELTLPALREQVEGGDPVVDESNTSAEATLALLEEYVEEGVLREDGPVTRIVPPGDVALWPYVSAFLVVLAVVGAAVASVASSLSVAVVERVSVRQFGAVLVGSILYLAVHEYGHYAVSDRHFDPSVRFDFVNGVVPAVVTDTTGSWLLPRNRRILINLAGPLVELGAALPLVVLHYAAGPNVVVDLLLVSVFAHVLLSLNPLIHGDGFWILCDFFGLVNVRREGIDDLTHGRPSWNAVYVVVSYGFGALLFVYMASMVASSLGLIDVPLPFA